jgi:hypothetical protein
MRTAANLLAAVLFLCAGGARAQVAPGPLSHAHQQLDSITKCGTCHQFKTTARELKCLSCHTEIQRRVEAKVGFHGSALQTDAGPADCRRCHQEHKGQTTPLIKLDRQKFDHQAQAGFALAGKHRQLKCESCHNAARIPPAARAEIKLKDPNRSFLGLRRDCLGCHKDQHQSQLGTDCLRCHNMDGFKPVTGFNHESSAFPLKGRHQTVACQKCHGPNATRETAQYKGLPHNGCQDCHNDPHRGAFQEVQFRGACETCHNPGGWKSNRPGSEFDHRLTKFPLEGKHTAAVCSACHKSTDFHRPVPHERCRDCHEDPHKGQFANRAAGNDCSSCHAPTGFKPTRFERETHRLSAFPLEGKHAAVDCAKCHKPEGKATVYRTGKLACSACHEDRHGGQFASAPHSNQCNQCHTTAGFKPPSFTVERHAQTQFALTGRHASVACEKCHAPLQGSETVRRYRFEQRSCNSCHTDPHGTKLACETCHTPEQWKATRPFDHPTATLRIEGAHGTAKCVQCHQPAAELKPPRFSETPTRCAGCHQSKDAHGGQFLAAARTEDCSQCHVPVRWRGDDFDHDKTQFVLSRVHRGLDCAKCHKDRREVAGKLVRMYRDTPRECVQCH